MTRTAVMLSSDTLRSGEGVRHRFWFCVAICAAPQGRALQGGIPGRSLLSPIYNCHHGFGWLSTSKYAGLHRLSLLTKKTAICPGRTPLRVSGERRFTVARRGWGSRDPGCCLGAAPPRGVHAVLVANLPEKAKEKLLRDGFRRSDKAVHRSTETLAWCGH